MALNILPQDLKEDLIKMKRSDLSVTNITRLFGTTSSKVEGKFVTNAPKFDVRMPVTLKAGEYINKKDIVTTVGSILFNKLLIEGRFENIIPDGFVNDEMTKSKMDDMTKIIVDALKAGKTTVEILADYLKAYENYVLKLVTIFSPSYSMNMLKPNTEMRTEKRNAIRDNPVHSTQDMANMEDDLVKMAKGKLADDPAMSLYDSGARGSFKNNYKTMSLMIGAVENPATKEYDFVESNLVDGIQKQDLVAAGNIVVTSEYPKAVGTQVGGYLTKQFYAVFQSIVLDAPGSDCGSKAYLKLVLTPDLVEPMMYQYIKVGEKLVMLSEDNKNQFINKTVLFRSPMYCLSDKVCSKCAGERFYMMEMENIGLTSGKISNNLLNASMKKRHDITVYFDTVDLNKLLI